MQWRLQREQRPRRALLLEQCLHADFRGERVRSNHLCFRYDRLRRDLHRHDARSASRYDTERQSVWRHLYPDILSECLRPDDFCEYRYL